MMLAPVFTAWQTALASSPPYWLLVAAMSVGMFVNLMALVVIGWKCAERFGQMTESLRTLTDEVKLLRTSADKIIRVETEVDNLKAQIERLAPA